MRLALLVLLGALVLTACGGGTSAPSGPQTIRVPADHATIQDAVDAAQRGDIVLVAPGEYRESVHIKKEGITLRGEDRNTVILDGEDQRQNGVYVTVGGVAVENLTVRRFANNGVLFTSFGEEYLHDVIEEGGEGETPTRDQTDPTQTTLDGFRVSYVTAYNNGLYGLYAFAAVNGVFEDSYASGHPDSGYYVGQCKPCNTVLQRVTAERNAIGYEGTNASGGVFIVDSLFTHNRLGITPNSQDAERLAPQGDTVVAGNRVIDNSDPNTPEIENGYFGGGILIGGGEGADADGPVRVVVHKCRARDRRLGRARQRERGDQGEQRQDRQTATHVGNVRRNCASEEVASTILDTRVPRSVTDVTLQRRAWPATTVTRVPPFDVAPISHQPPTASSQALIVAVPVPASASVSGGTPSEVISSRTRPSSNSVRATSTDVARACLSAFSSTCSVMR